MSGVHEVVARLTVPTALPPDVRRLAVRCGLVLKASERHREMLRNRRVYYDATAQPDEKDKQVARCVARHALRCMLGRADRVDVECVAGAIVGWASAAAPAAPAGET